MSAAAANNGAKDTGGNRQFRCRARLARGSRNERLGSLIIAPTGDEGLSSLGDQSGASSRDYNRASCGTVRRSPFVAFASRYTRESQESWI